MQLLISLTDEETKTQAESSQSMSKVLQLVQGNGGRGVRIKDLK